jgi:hypothetical protein
LIVDDVINVVDYHENYQQELSAFINMTWSVEPPHPPSSSNFKSAAFSARRRWW